MGCFSYMCKKCETSIRSDSHSGELCELFLLKDGKVIEHLSGAYDSYGRTFEQDWKVMKWAKIVSLHFGAAENSGIAAVHKKCWDGDHPTAKSDDDPNQGWDEMRKEYMDNERTTDMTKTKLGEGSTPGPWKLSQILPNQQLKPAQRSNYAGSMGYVWTDRPYLQGVCVAMVREELLGEVEANARLIAKAPLLIEAREVLERLLQVIPANAIPFGEADEARALIAKLEED